MKKINALPLSLVLTGLAFLWSPAAPVQAQNQAPPVELPKPGVPQIMTMEGKFVRAAYNNEAYVILGYQPANRSIGEEWLLIEVGLTTLDDSSPTMMRTNFTLDTPEGATLPLPSTPEFRAASTAALQNRAKVQRDSINYFPPEASRACRIGFFSDLADKAMAWDQFEATSDRACMGRLYFHVPGGIKYGQYWLNVKFTKSTVRVPFRILTEDEEKMLSKNYKSISKQVEEAFKPKKKK